MKTVRVTLEIPPEFLRHLHTNQQMLNATRSANTPTTASDLIARLVYLEARGAPEEDITAEVPGEWREEGSLKIVHDERRVYEGGKLIAGPEVINSQ